MINVRKKFIALCEGDIKRHLFIYYTVRRQSKVVQLVCPVIGMQSNSKLQRMKYKFPVTFRVYVNVSKKCNLWEAERSLIIFRSKNSKVQLDFSSKLFNNCNKWINFFWKTGGHQSLQIERLSHADFGPLSVYLIYK